MPTAAEELPNLGQLKADIQVIAHNRDVLAEQLLDSCVTIDKGVRRTRATIEADLRQGVEARQFLRSLAIFKEYGAEVLEVYAVVKEAIADWKKGTDALAPLIEEADAFIGWLDDLLVRLNRPAPPIDEEMLRLRERQCDVAKAWVNFDNALAELKKSEG